MPEDPELVATVWAESFRALPVRVAAMRAFSYWAIAAPVTRRTGRPAPKGGSSRFRTIRSSSFRDRLP